MTYTELVKEMLMELDRTLSQVDYHSAEEFRVLIRGAKRIFLAGKGRSGLQIRGFAMRLMHAGFIVHVVDDVTTPALRSDDLIIIGSGSGRTQAMVGYAEIAQKIGARIALITIDPESTIAQKADSVIVLPAPTPKLGNDSQGQSVLPMGSLFEHSLGLFCDLTIVELMRELNLSAEKMFERHANLE
jgi:6-phospho-3-hexuloisomerase